jgi:beta-galactosidase
VDLVGIPKDRFYLYKSYWKPEETTLHVLPHWNWPDRVGQEVPVFVYTNGDCAELFLNGESLGMKCKDPKSNSSVERFRLMWRDVIYAPGELRAVAYREGVKIEEKVMKTVGEPARLRLQADRPVLQAGGMDLSYVLVEAVDEEGHTVPLADDRLNIELEGEGILAGAGNGNPRSFEPLQDQEVDLFYGKAMLIIRSGETPGTIRLSVHAEGLEGAEATLEVR